MTHMNLNQKYKWLVPSASIFALILVILYALGMIGGGEKVGPGNSEVKIQPPPENASMLTITKQSAENLLSWPGTVRARTVAKIAPKLNARILEVKVNAGDFVKQGDIIARLDERIFRAAYNEASAALTAAKALASQASADAARIKELYEQEAATRENYDAVVARARAAQASV
ncbi:MAG: biotin/lipoyl-binding protein, partial [Gammaproteobacteria bacterium]